MLISLEFDIYNITLRVTTVSHPSYTEVVFIIIEEIGLIYIFHFVKFTCGKMLIVKKPLHNFC